MLKDFITPFSSVSVITVTRAIVLIINRFSRAQGRAINARSTTSAGRCIFSKRITVRPRCFGALRNRVEGAASRSSWRKRLRSLSLRRIIDGARATHFTQSLSIRRGRDETILFPSVFSVAPRATGLYKPKSKAVRESYGDFHVTYLGAKVARIFLHSITPDSRTHKCINNGRWEASSVLNAPRRENVLR